MLPALAALGAVGAAAWGLSVSAAAAELELAATGAATGWLPDAHFAAQWGLKGRCDIERLHEAPSRARLLTAAQPLIFRGEEPGNGALRAAVSREALLRRCGAQSVVLGTAEELATEGRGRLTSTLAEYVGGVMRGADPQRGRQSYAFEAGLLERCERQGQPPGRGDPSASLYRKPGALASADSFQADLVFAVGASGSGIPFHHHTHAYNELLAGAKRWSFLPPGDRDLDEGVRRRGHLAWLREVLPGLPPGGVLECTQQPGDVIFVPEGWWHATLNLGEVLAVAQLSSTAHTDADLTTAQAAPATGGAPPSAAASAAQQAAEQAARGAAERQLALVKQLQAVKTKMMQGARAAIAAGREPPDMTAAVAELQKLQASFSAQKQVAEMGAGAGAAGGAER